MEQSLPPYEMLPTGANMNTGDVQPAGTDVDETLKSTTVQVQVEEERPFPRDHIIWSLCTALYGNVCCLGLLAFFFSVKSRDRKVLGDHSGALSYGSTAKCLNITALVINIVIVIIAIVIIAVVVSSATHTYHSYG